MTISDKHRDKAREWLWGEIRRDRYTDERQRELERSLARAFAEIDREARELGQVGEKPPQDQSPYQEK